MKHEEFYERLAGIQQRAKQYAEGLSWLRKVGYFDKLSGHDLECWFCGLDNVDITIAEQNQLIDDLLAGGEANKIC